MEDELHECITDMTLSGNLQEIVFSFCKLETETRRDRLKDKYNEYINIQPQHVGIDEKFTLNEASPILQIYDYQIQMKHRINQSLSDMDQTHEADSNSGDEYEDSEISQDQYRAEKDVSGSVDIDNENSKDDNFIYQEKKKKRPKSKQKKAKKQICRSKEMSEDLNVDHEFSERIQNLSVSNAPARPRFYSGKREENKMPTLEEVKERICQKPYHQAITKLREIENIKEPGKKLRLMNQVNDLILK